MSECQGSGDFSDPVEVHGVNNQVPAGQEIGRSQGLG